MKSPAHFSPFGQAYAGADLYKVQNQHKGGHHHVKIKQAFIGAGAQVFLQGGNGLSAQFNVEQQPKINEKGQAHQRDMNGPLLLELPASQN